MNKTLLITGHHSPRHHELLLDGLLVNLPHCPFEYLLELSAAWLEGWLEGWFEPTFVFNRESLSCQSHDPDDTARHLAKRLRDRLGKDTVIAGQKSYCLGRSILHVEIDKRVLVNPAIDFRIRHRLSDAIQATNAKSSVAILPC